jgi:hypothetical protein
MNLGARLLRSKNLWHSDYSNLFSLSLKDSYREANGKPKIKEFCKKFKVKKQIKNGE